MHGYLYVSIVAYVHVRLYERRQEQMRVRSVIQVNPRQGKYLVCSNSLKFLHPQQPVQAAL